MANNRDPDTSQRLTTAFSWRVRRELNNLHCGAGSYSFLDADLLLGFFFNSY